MSKLCISIKILCFFVTFQQCVKRIHKAVEELESAVEEGMLLFHGNIDILGISSRCQRLFSKYEYVEETNKYCVNLNTEADDQPFNGSAANNEEDQAQTQALIDKSIGCVEQIKHCNDFEGPSFSLGFTQEFEELDKRRQQKEAHKTDTINKEVDDNVNDFIKANPAANTKQDKQQGIRATETQASKVRDQDNVRTIDGTNKGQDKAQTEDPKPTNDGDVPKADSIESRKIVQESEKEKEQEEEDQLEEKKKQTVNEGEEEGGEEENTDQEYQVDETSVGFEKNEKKKRKVRFAQELKSPYVNKVANITQNLTTAEKKISRALFAMTGERLYVSLNPLLISYIKKRQMHIYCYHLTLCQYMCPCKFYVPHVLLFR